MFELIDKLISIFDCSLCETYIMTRKLARSTNGKILCIYSPFTALCYSKQNFLVEKHCWRNFFIGNSAIGHLSKKFSMLCPPLCPTGSNDTDLKFV